MTAIQPPWQRALPHCRSCRHCHHPNPFPRAGSHVGFFDRRIAIARAIIRNTPILILDEPTAGLDAVSQQAVMEALDRLIWGRTSVVIAHRLGTIRRADAIFVIEDCELAEQARTKRSWPRTACVQNCTESKPPVIPRSAQFTSDRTAMTVTGKGWRTMR